MPTGLALVIDEKMVKQLEAADHLITDIATKSEMAEARLTTAFRNMGDKGVGHLIGKLHELQDKMDSLNTSGFGKIFNNVAADSAKSLDEINKVVSSIRQTKEALVDNNDGQKATLFDVDREKKRIAELKKEIANISRWLNEGMEGHGKGKKKTYITLERQQELVDLKASLKEQLKIQETSLAKLNASYDKAYADFERELEKKEKAFKKEQEQEVRIAQEAHNRKQKELEATFSNADKKREEADKAYAMFEKEMAAKEESQKKSLESEKKVAKESHDRKQKELEDTFARAEKERAVNDKAYKDFVEGLDKKERAFRAEQERELKAAKEAHDKKQKQLEQTFNQSDRDKSQADKAYSDFVAQLDKKEKAFRAEQEKEARIAKETHDKKQRELEKTFSNADKQKAENDKAYADFVSDLEKKKRAVERNNQAIIESERRKHDAIQKQLEAAFKEDERLQRANDKRLEQESKAQELRDKERRSRQSKNAEKKSERPLTAATDVAFWSAYQKQIVAIQARVKNLKEANKEANKEEVRQLEGQIKLLREKQQAIVRSNNDRKRGLNGEAAKAFDDEMKHSKKVLEAMRKYYAAEEAMSASQRTKDKERYNRKREHAKRLAAMYTSLINEELRLQKIKNKASIDKDTKDFDKRVFAEQAEKEAEHRLAEINKKKQKLERMHLKEIEEIRKRSYANQSDEILQQRKRVLAQEAAMEREAERERKKNERKKKEDTDKANSTFDGSTAYSKEANSIKERTQAIKYLTKAREELKTSDADYNKKLKSLNDEILRHKVFIENATKASKMMASSHKTLMDISGQLARRLALLFSVSQITQYVKKLIEVRGEFELQQKSLQSILKSKSDANQLWERTVQLAVNSPFRVKELITYTKQLAAYRIETSKLYETNKMLADVSAGLGVDMNRLILAYGQVKAANYLRGTELRQFSEAGVNILGELAQYFTEIKGEAISVGQVFEMVSKRMVKFGDVEQVFKRLTQEGGIFYRMQEEQSETLKGKISNLRDSFDLMYNSIGQSNDGMLKGMVDAVKSLVENWELLAAAIKASGVALAVVGLTKFVQGLRSTGEALQLAASEGVAFTKAAAKLKLALKGIQPMLAAHPILMSVAALGALITAVIALSGKQDELNKEYDKQNLLLFESNKKTTKRLSLIDKEIKANNTNLKTLKESMRTMKSGTEDYENAQRNLNQAQSEQIKILSKLKNEFPEIYEGLTKQEDGTVNLTNAIEEFTKKTEALIVMNELAKGKGAFGEDLKTNYKDASDSYNKLITAQKSAIAGFKSVGVELTKIKKGGLLDIQYVTELEKKLDDIFSSGNDINKYMKAREEFSKSYQRIIEQNANIGDASVAFRKINDVLDGIKSRGRLGGVVDDYNDAIKDFGVNIDRTADAIKGTYNLNTVEGRKSARDVMTEFLKSMGVVKEELLSFARNQYEIRLGVKFNWNETPPKKELLEWQKKWNDTVVKQSTSGILDKISDEATQREDIIKKLQADYTDYKKIIDRFKQAGQDAYSKEDYEDAQRKIEEISKGFKFFGVLPKELVKDNKKEHARLLAQLKDQIKLLVELKAKYDDLKNDFGKGVSTKKVKDSFRQTFQTFFNDILSFDEIDFTTNKGTKQSLERLSERAALIGEDAVKALQKAVSEQSVLIDVEIRQKEDKSIIDQINALFGDYEMSLELEKLDFPADLAEQLFDIESISLPDLRLYIESIDLSDKGEKFLSEYNDILKKLDDMEQKAHEERLKKYTKYLLDAQSERIKIKLEELRQIAEVEEEERYTEEQKNQILEAIRKESSDKMKKEEWKSFSDSEWYVELFSDLSKLSQKSLDILYNQVNRIKDSLGEMPVEVLSEVTKQITDLENRMEKNTPIKGLFEGIAGYTKYLGERKDIDREIKFENAKNIASKNFLKNAEEGYAIAQQSYKTAVSQYHVGSMQEQNAKRQLNSSREILKNAKKEYEESNKNLSVLWKKVKNADEFKKKMELGFSAMSSYVGAISNTVGSVSSSLENVFGPMSDKAKDAIASFQEISAGVSGMMDGAAKIASGDVFGGTLTAISGLASTIGAVFQIGDKKKERQIQAQIKLIQKLQKEYEKLGEIILNTYNIDEYEKSFRASRSNLEAQIASTEKMIKLEQDKKKTDHSKIEKYKEDIEQYQKMLKELESKRIEDLGGLGSKEAYKSITQGFVDAWMQAYKETGDGLDGLQEHFDSFFEGAIKKQLVMRATDKYLTQFYKEFDRMFAENSDAGGNVTRGELDNIKDRWKETSTGLNEMLKSLVESLGLSADLLGKDSPLSGLQQGIQGITEDTAQIIEAYLNSIRLFISDTNQKISVLVERMSNQDNNNPILSSLHIIADNANAINTLLQSVVRTGHPMGDSGIKVFLN